MNHPLRRYRATYVPESVSPADAELKADQGALPSVQFQAENSGKAAEIAHAVTGRPILRVDRIEGVLA